MNFRLDINGLRFFAVAMVVLFHFKFSFAYGGFAGVDIFFVISGFLMNEICQRQIGKKGWVIDFYRKRFKRIYPALFVSVLMFFIISIVIYPPSITESIYKQVISALTFTSNIFYWKDSSEYFVDDADSLFLLHTWSLSAEWQFYLIFPAFIYAASKIKIKNIKPYLYALAIITSFLLCVVVTKKSPSASFYLLPTRAWELFLGAFVSSLAVKNKYPKATEITSLLVIIAFTLTVKESAAWPGMMTLIPTVAAAALIHAAVKNEESLLRFSPLQSIGTASYSIYLFHWPIVSIFYLYQIEFSAFNATIGVILSIAIGFASYAMIEKRMRLSIPVLISSSVTVMVVSFAMSGLGVSKYWLPQSVIALDKYHNYFETEEGMTQFGNNGRTCFLTSVRNNASLFDEDTCLIKDGSRKRLLLIGDSHAAQFYDAVKESFPDYDVMQATASGCLPLLSPVGEKRCTSLINKVYEKYINKYKIDMVVVTGNWITEAKRLGNMNSLVERMVISNAALKKSVENVFFIGQTKIFKYPMYRTVQVGNEENIASQELIDIKEFNDSLVAALSGTNIKYIDIYSYGCSDSDCSYVDKSGTPFMFDSNHMTMPWSVSVMKDVSSAINNLIKQ
ncbi:acyltransferase family protein [Klebsiella pneumoniae]|uniref:acyltransferase family protein n=1 Tax=Klebsiella pneumoniae TaxID=573 RepID=UPI0010835575|nr:acyltransferase family protein [Klebsiella pneumoniae]